MTVESRRPIYARPPTGLGDFQPIRGHGGQGTGKKADVMNAEFAVMRDSQPMVTTCALCGETNVGLAGPGRDWFRAHLADMHPEVKLPRRGRSRTGWARVSAEEKAEAMVEVEARRKAMLA